MLKVLELFGGIGACSEALTQLGIEYEIADYVEIDKYAVASFNAIHNTNFEPQDICEWNKQIPVDFILHGSPCQDFSVAGRGAGGDEGSGTRSSLLYETVRIVENLMPKYVIWENVKNLLSKKHRHNFEAYLKRMEELGYTNYYQVLNAKDYGIPQNRERVFTISILGGGDFKFPEPIELVKKLKDVLEDNVDEKYYVSSKQLTGMATTNYESYKLSKLLKGKDETADTIKARFEGCPQMVSTGGTELQREVCDKALKEGLVKPNDVIEYTFSNARLKEIEKGKIKKQNLQDNSIMSTLKTNPQGLGVTVETPKEPFVVASRGRDPENPSDRTPGNPHLVQRLEPKFDGTTNTITTVQKDNYVALPGAYGREFGSKGKIQDLDKEVSTLQAAMGEGGGNVPLVPTTYRIRKLTPKECWRLMGFSDESFEKAAKVNSNTQLYKQAGNSIVVDVLKAIFKNLF